MDEIISQIVKFLSNTVIVRISSYPPFAIEIILSSVICIVHLLLIYEINILVKRTNAKAAERIRTKVGIKDVDETQCSIHSMVTLHTAYYQKNSTRHELGDLIKPPTFCVPFKKMNKISTTSNFGWALTPRRQSILKNNNFTERVEHLLSISPSEYVRRDKERKNKEAGLRSCLQSLTSLLEKALNSDHLVLNTISKDEMKKSIETIRDNFESQIVDDKNFTDFPSPSLQSLIAKSTAQNALESSLSPNLIQSVYHASKKLKLSSSAFDSKKRNMRDDEYMSQGDSVENLVLQKSESLSELFRKDTKEFYGDGIKDHSRIVLAK